LNVHANSEFFATCLLGDTTHLSHPAGRDEFVNAEVGKIYGGSHNHIQGRPWVFGQTKDSVLPAVCHLLDKVSKLRDSERNDPVKVSRAISALVNSNDENGVLEGRWDGNYSDGTSPSEWTGSVAILEEYMRNGGRTPVKYGQCWVFSAVVTTG
jgi:transglutaminase 1